jgi:hypothetical protein
LLGGVPPDSSMACDSIVDRLSRPLYNKGEFSGPGGNWLDETAGQATGRDSLDGNRHLAKVGVAGSNPSSAPKMQVRGVYGASATWRLRKKSTTRHAKAKW